MNICTNYNHPDIPGFGEHDEFHFIETDQPSDHKEAYYTGDYEGALFEGEENRMMDYEEDVAASTWASISAAPPVAAQPYVRNIDSMKSASQTSAPKPQGAESAAASFCYDSFFDITKTSIVIQMFVDQHLVTRKGVTSVFSPSTSTWYVVLLHGSQDCAATLRLAPSALFAPGSPEGSFRLTGKLERGEKEYFNMLFDEVREYFAKRSNGRSSAVSPRSSGSRASNLEFYSAPHHLAVIDLLIVDVQRRDAPQAQAEALRTLCDLAQDATLAELLHSRGCTVALILMLSSANLAYSGADLFDTSSHCRAINEMTCFALLALSNLSSVPDALLTIAQADSGISQLFIAVCNARQASEPSLAADRLALCSTAHICECLRKRMLGDQCERVVHRLRELVQQRSPRGSAGPVSSNSSSSTRSGKGYGVWTEQLAHCMGAMSEVSISINV